MDPVNAVKTEAILSLLPPEQREKPPFFYTAAELERLVESLHCERNELYLGLCKMIQPFAVIPQSGFKVGACFIGESGNAYLGVNLEFSELPLCSNVHAEQCALSHAWIREEKRIVKIALTYVPCGHCRQFLAELENFDKIELVLEGRAPTLLSTFLPSAFVPTDLKIDSSLVSPLRSIAPVELAVSLDDPSISPIQKDLIQHAVRAAKRSYSPANISGGSWTGCALRAEIPDSTGAKHAVVVSGGYLENIAFNPSLWPINVALVGLRTLHHCADWSCITDAVIVENPAAKSRVAEFGTLEIKILSKQANVSVFPLKINAQ